MVWGIPIKVHISLLLMLLFFVSDPGFGVLGGLLIALGLAASIVMHELGHSLVAIRKGCRVREITLMFLGGAARMERIPTKPRDELLMALAGPAVSLLIAILAVFLGSRLPLPPLRRYPVNFLQALGVINFGLMCFNLLPAFPMDGGRVLRALLTGKLGRLKATFLAARLGRILAIAGGILGLLWTPTQWLLVGIAFFVYISAGHEYRMVEAQEQMRGAAPSGGEPVPPPRDGGEDRVVIGPPPYAKGRDTETRVQSSRPRDLFGNGSG